MSYWQKRAKYYLFLISNLKKQPGLLVDIKCKSDFELLRQLRYGPYTELGILFKKVLIILVYRVQFPLKIHVRWTGIVQVYHFIPHVPWAGVPDLVLNQTCQSIIWNPKHLNEDKTEDRSGTDVLQIGLHISILWSLTFTKSSLSWYWYSLKLI